MERTQGRLGWLRRKRLDEPNFLLRHLEIGAALALRFPADTLGEITGDDPENELDTKAEAPELAAP